MLAAARPADPALLNIHQADGTVISARLHGDEHFSYFTTPDNKTVLEYSSKGNLQPAMRQGRVLTTSREDLQLLASESMSTEMNAAAQTRAAVQQRMAALTSEGRSTYQTIGEVHTPVFLVEFEDRKFTVPEPVDLFNRRLNEKGFSDYNAKGSVRDYYEASSCGKFQPIFDVYGPISVSKKAAYYVGDASAGGAGGKYQYFAELLHEAMTKADTELNVDFSQYDLDKDGLIDNVFVYYAGYGQADTGYSDCIWPHQGDYRYKTPEYGNTMVPTLILDGVKLATYATSCELNGNWNLRPQQPYLDGIGAFCHEYGHVLGLPDLYDVYPPETCKTPGRWDIMDQGSYNDYATCPPLFSAYERWVCNWIEAENLDRTTSDKHLVMAASTAEGPTTVPMIRVPRAGSGFTPEFYLLESRDKDANTWDRPLDAAGIMIWRINYDNQTWITNQVNSGVVPNIEIISPDWDSNDIFWPGITPGSTEIYPNGQFSLRPQRLTRALPYYITEIAYDADKKEGSFNFNRITEEPKISTVLSEAVKIDKYTNGSFDMTFNWQEVPEAEDYLITVIRVLPSGTEKTYQGLQDTSIGKVTSFKLNRLESFNYNYTFKVYIRCKVGVPASTTSNVLEFKPAEAAAVEGIEAEALDIYVDGQSIVAPAGSRIYNLQGIESGSENLAKGMYLVVYQGQTRKVTIR